MTTYTVNWKAMPARLEEKIAQCFCSVLISGPKRKCHECGGNYCINCQEDHGCNQGVKNENVDD